MARYYVDLAGVASDAELDTRLQQVEDDFAGAIAAETTARQQAIASIAPAPPIPGLQNPVYLGRQATYLSSNIFHPNQRFGVKKNKLIVSITCSAAGMATGVSYPLMATSYKAGSQIWTILSLGLIQNGSVYNFFLEGISPGIWGFFPNAGSVWVDVFAEVWEGD